MLDCIVTSVNKVRESLQSIVSARVVTAGVRGPGVFGCIVTSSQTCVFEATHRLGPCSVAIGSFLLTHVLTAFS